MSNARDKNPKIIESNSKRFKKRELEERVYNKNETRNNTKKMIKFFHEISILFFKEEIFWASFATPDFLAILYYGYFGL